MDKMREEFEAWAESFDYDLRIGVVDGINGYLDEMTQGAWMGWQAARQSTGQERGQAVAWLRKNGFRFNGDIEPQDDSEIPLYAHPPADAQRIAELEAQLTESREREGRMREALEDYVSQDEIAGSNGYGIGGETQRKAEALLAALAAEKEGE